MPYSPSDDHGEARVAATLQGFFPGEVMGSLLLTPSGFRGRVWLPAGVPRPVSAITEVGRTVRRLWTKSDSESHLRASTAQIHDRQIRAFGQAGQALIEATRVGIVGVGGTGSPLAEQLVRLGVRDLLLIDRDEVLESSNLSRVYGSAFSDVHPSWWQRVLAKRPRSKVTIVAEHLRAINPHARIRAFRADVTEASAARRLLDCDVIFACTDEHWGRAVLNQIAYQYLIPVVNLGVAIDGPEGTITGAVGVVQVLRPGLGCLWCGNYLNSERIRAESLPPDARQALEAEGYLRGVAEPAPSVVTITTAVAGLAGTLFLQLVTDFMASAGAVARINYFPLEAVAARGRVPVKTPCLCSKVKGKGDLEPLPVVPGRSVA
ncbi:MAG: ThiF family adenylyltransferase [Candidatus Wallbacteria bacterium]|nr:ThiF family adenylyltransferase [Candidatus Wallbacteria bacterium]